MAPPPRDPIAVRGPARPDARRRGQWLPTRSRAGHLARRRSVFHLALAGRQERVGSDDTPSQGCGDFCSRSSRTCGSAATSLIDGCLRPCNSTSAASSERSPRESRHPGYQVHRHRCAGADRDPRGEKSVLSTWYEEDRLKSQGDAVPAARITKPPDGSAALKAAHPPRASCLQVSDRSTTSRPAGSSSFNPPQKSRCFSTPPGRRRRGRAGYRLLRPARSSCGSTLRPQRREPGWRTRFQPMERPRGP